MVFSNYFGKRLNNSGNMTTTQFEFEKLVGQSGYHPYFSFSRKGKFLSKAFFEVLRSSAGFNKVRCSLPPFLCFSPLGKNYSIISAFVSGPLFPTPKLGISVDIADNRVNCVTSGSHQTKVHTYHCGSVTVVWMLT